MFGKGWPIVLYMRFNQKKTRSDTIDARELRTIIGYFYLNKYLPWLSTEAPVPMIKRVKSIDAIKQEQYSLTKLGVWYADYMWSVADVLLKSDKGKTLTEILEERRKTLALTIKEINQIASGDEQEIDALSEKIIETNPKSPASVSID